jgi:hypothetical protein
MKKYFIIAVAAIAAMAACSKVDVVDTPARKITFEPASYVPQTKAHSLNSESINAFNCQAYMKGEGVVAMQDFFGASGETITYKSGTDTWEPSHDYYWPKSTNSYVNFFSWYDTGAGPTTVTNGTMAWTNRTIGTGDNIMYADPAWHFQQNTTNDSQYTGDTITEGVPTIFHHALAQVNFKAYANKTSVEGLCTWTIVLKNVAITNVYNQGTLSLTTTEPAEATKNTVGTWTSPAWTTTGSAASLTPANLTVTATPSTSANTLLANQSVLPQDLSNVHLTFDLDITTTYTAGQTNHEIIPIDIPLAGSTGFNTSAWALNHKYTYIVKVVPSENKVLFDPAIEEEWVEETAAEKEI